MLRKLLLASGAVLAASVAHAGPVIMGGIPTPSPPAYTAQNTTRFYQDNGTAYATSQTPVNNYLSVPAGAPTTCQSGKSPQPFGLPCAGSNSFVAQQDFFQGVSFITGDNPPILTDTRLEIVAAGANGGSAGTGNCSSGNDKCIGLQLVGSSNAPGYEILYLSLAVGGNGFWPAACGGQQLKFGQVLPAHRYSLFWGTRSGLPWVALVDGVSGAVTTPSTCSTSIWGSATYVGTGVSSGGSTIANTTTITSIGAQPAATTAFKAGWGGSIGPAFSFVGTFPGSGGAPDGPTLSKIATGQLNLPTSPLAGTTCQAYYSLADVGTWADSCHNYGNLTASYTFPTTAPNGSPAIAPPAVTITEKPSEGFTFRLDPATIVPNGTQICYSGSPATGTVYRSGTWSSQGGGRPSRLIYRVYNSSGIQIGQQTVQAKANGTWSVALSGIPWGTGYTDSIEWANSPGKSGRYYKSALPFNVGLLLGVDSQSEGVFANYIPNTNDILSYNSEPVSVFEFPLPGFGNINDEAGQYAINMALSQYNTPGVSGNPGGASAADQGYFIDYTAHKQAAGDGATALLKTAYAVSGCPVTVAFFGRPGHAREQFAFDHVRIPSPVVASSATYTGAGASISTNANVTANGGNSPTYILPGTLSIIIPYTGGATVTATDNGYGGLTFTDGSTGYTNYGFNEITLDASALATALGFAPATTNSENGATYWWANSCRPSAPANVCTGGASQGVIKGSVSFASTSTVIGSGGATAHVCINQPNIPDALPHFCTNGTGTGSLSAQQITVTLGTTTIGQLISAINALPSASLVTAGLSGGTSGFFVLQPNSNSDIAITTASTCDATCLANISTTWTTDVETYPANGILRGESENGGSATPTQIPDGFGVFGDSVNPSTGHVSAMLSDIQAPFSAYIEVIGASNLGQTLANMQATQPALWAKYAAATNADPNTGVAVLTYHRTGVSSLSINDFSIFNNQRSFTQTIGKQGGIYYSAGDLGLYDILNYTGPHPSWFIGGGWLWGQGLGESWIDAVLQNHSTTYSAGGSWTSAAFTTQTTFGALTFSSCATAHTCILVTATLGTGDTALVTAGGQTAASGAGPSTCPTYPSTVTDGDVSFYCLGAWAPRANSTAVNLGQIVQGAPTGVSGSYTNGYLYQVTQAGTSAASNPITSANYVGNHIDGHSGLADGTADIAFLGFALPYANSQPLMAGQTITANGNAYVVAGSNVSSPIGHSCMDFYVKDTAILSGRPIAADGWDPQAGPPAFDGPTFSCTIVSSNQVLLVKSSGTWSANPNTSILYNGGYPAQRYAVSLPSDPQTIAQFLTGNRGFGGLQTQTLQGVPIQPLLTPMTVN